MNSRVLANEKQKPQSWLIFLFSIVLLIVLISLSSLAYKKWNTDKGQQINLPALISQQQLILAQEDVINTNWLRTLDPFIKNVEGRIVWSKTLQKGVMEFVGLPEISDNKKYQLWIYDLVGNNTNPLLSAEFTKVSLEKTLILFSSKSFVNSPFKFELLLKTDGEETSQPLFLAQP